MLVSLDILHFSNSYVSYPSVLPKRAVRRALQSEYDVILCYEASDNADTSSMSGSKIVATDSQF